MVTIEKNFLRDNLKIVQIIETSDIENWNKVIKFLSCLIEVLNKLIFVKTNKQNLSG